MESKNTESNQNIINDLNNKIKSLEAKNKDLTERSINKINNLKKEIELISINQFHSKNIGKISEALSKAQSEMLIAGKSSSGYNFSYADLTEYVKASRPALTKYGLSVVQLLNTINDKDYLITILSHEKSGEWFKSSFKVTVGNSVSKMSTEQRFGSVLTYIKKYSFASLVGVVASKEIDSDYSK